MQVINQQLQYGLSFEEYQSLPGWSHSAIKEWERGSKIEPTEKMKIGTMVHNYLLEPSLYNHEKREIVIPAANAVKNVIGALLQLAKCEVSMTADFVHEGIKMQYRGRADILIPEKIVVDIKVSDKPLAQTIPFFGYGNAMSGYALAANCRAAIIIRVCPKKFNTEVKVLPISSEWWKSQVLKFGTPA